jgi:cobalamin biosynthetic protein CobC
MAEESSAALSNRLRHHGGDINAARALFPNAPLPWIDLSTGINAVPYPVGDVSATAWTHLPEPAAIARLEAAAAKRYGARGDVAIVAAPGSQALIQWLPRLFSARTIGVLGPTYGEHARSWSQAGAIVETVRDFAALERFEAAVIVNPNNPDGRLISPSEVRALADRLAERGGMLVVDEAFMDVSDLSVVPQISERTIVLRSLGKAYGLAGLRLGFAAARGEMANRIRTALGPWAVSGAAIEIGGVALADEGWLAASVARLTIEATRLDALLAGAGFELVGGTLLFRLAQSARAQDWFQRLCAAGILTRPFVQQAEWLRFGVPHQDAHWARLEAALSA